MPFSEIRILRKPLLIKGVAIALFLAGYATELYAHTTNGRFVYATASPDKRWTEYPTRAMVDLSDYVPTKDLELSTYGGLKADPRKSTGFFRTEKVGERWWLIDPTGCKYINVGVVAVSVLGTSETSTTAMKERFHTKDAWATATIKQLRDNGFNGTGAWSDDAVLRATEKPIVYTPIWNFMSEYGKKRGGMYQESGHMGYPKGCIFVFDPEFPAFCDEYARTHVYSLKNDPWLLGHFSDNEIPFYYKALDNYLALPKQDPGRNAAENWIAQRRSERKSSEVITQNDRQDFLGFMADKYFSITSAAIRKYDPNHMVIGARFYGYELCVAPLFQAVGKHLDVVSINYYNEWTPDLRRMQHWADWSQKPFIITEWYAKGMDSGYANMSGAGWTVSTQRDRGLFYQNFTLSLLESGACVGWHWFKYTDNDPNDKSADPSNTDSNKGIVSLRFDPYEPLLSSMRELNTQVYSLADYFDRKKP